MAVLPGVVGWSPHPEARLSVWSWHLQAGGQQLAPTGGAVGVGQQGGGPGRQAGGVSMCELSAWLGAGGGSPGANFQDLGRWGVKSQRGWPTEGGPGPRDLGSQWGGGGGAGRLWWSTPGGQPHTPPGALTEMLAGGRWVLSEHGTGTAWVGPAGGWGWERCWQCRRARGEGGWTGHGV